MIKKFSFCFLLVLSFSILFTSMAGAQQEAVDSLRQLLTEKKGDEKLSTQLDLATLLIKTDANEAKDLGRDVLKTAKKSGRLALEMRALFVLGKAETELKNYTRAQTCLDSALILSLNNDNWIKGETLFAIGVNKHRQGEYIEALKFFNEAIPESRKAGNFTLLGSSYSMMGNVFRMNGLYDRAIEYIIKAKLNYEKSDFIEGSAWTSYLLGRIYADLKQADTALEYFKKALEIYTQLAAKTGDKMGIAICYEQIGLLNIDAGEFDKAVENFEKTRDIYEVDQSQFGMSNVYKNLGRLEYAKGNYVAAEMNLKRALKIKEEVDDILSIPVIYEYLGLCLIGKGQIAAGIKKLQYGLDLAMENDQKKVQLDIYSKLTEAYRNSDDLEKAIECQNKQIQIQNLILSGAANIKTEQLQAIFEIDAKNSQIEELEKQNQIHILEIKQERIIRNVMVIAVVVAFLVALIIFWLYSKIQAKNRELKGINVAKDKFFAIIAHDLRGPTSGLTAFLEHITENFDGFKKEELKVILQTLYKSSDGVNQLLENLLIWAQTQAHKIEYYPASYELTEVLQRSIDTMKQAAENKEIDVIMELNDPVTVFADSNMVQTVVRNLLNNAIKFSHRGGSVTLKTEMKDAKTVQVSVVDRGVGIEKSKISGLFSLASNHHTNGTENEKSTGLGLILVNEFVDKNQGTLHIESEEGQGTVVSFTLPLG
ncbi:tetratricopeptide repeat protein [Mangrovibacterium lignilyticum]|uniref:tetratricopeptide repeat protein n=1 Tax=Mangrovibacterium lignilyticum TaxID=2668052 RepID=UPI0013D2FD5C|nr:tetratricopeptide repeat protein [Mangrovibacterium lignilyticum]